MGALRTPNNELRIANCEEFILSIMKRAIFALMLLTAVVTLPPFYGQWAESQRLKQIRATTQQARPIFGEQLDAVVSELKGGEPPSVVILYTGGTKSHLEPCGCYQEQSGGLPRRAHIVEQIREQGFPTLLVDAGNIFDGKEEIDTRRCRVNLKAMSAMGYDAAALSPADLAYGDAYLSQQCAVATFPFLTATQDDLTQSFVIKKVGQHTVAFVAGMAQEQVTSQADVVVALGNPEASNQIDVVIQPDEIETTKSDTGTLYIGAEPEGKTLGLLALWIDPNAGLKRHHATQLALAGDVRESASVRQLLTDFYQAAAESSDLTPLFAGQHLEQDAQNGYASAPACQQCHQQEYLQWSASGMLSPLKRF